MRFKGPNKYACKIGQRLVQFTANGTFETEEKELIDVLKTIKSISIVGEVEEEFKEVAKEFKEDLEYSLEEATNIYKDVIGKNVPNNKKNDLERIIKKIS